MKLVDRYIIKIVLMTISLVTFMLAGLQIFILFVNQLDDLGKGDYNLIAAIIYVASELPYQIYLFFPLASLLGSLVGLGILAHNHELIIMRAAGMSISQITSVILKSTIGLIFLVTLIGELIAPKIAFFGNKYKIQAITGNQALKTPQGIWLRYDNNFIIIAKIWGGKTLTGVYQFNFDDHNRLQYTRYLDKIIFNNHHWQAYDVQETRFGDSEVITTKYAELLWDLPLKVNFLKVANKAPDEMTINQLHHYLRAQKHTYQGVTNYRLAYLQRLVQPVTTMVMVLLAIPFIFGPLRASTMGAKILTGAVVGFSFHIFNRFFGPLSQVLQLSPVIAALGPTFIFALLGILLVRQAK